MNYFALLILILPIQSFGQTNPVEGMGVEVSVPYDKVQELMNPQKGCHATMLDYASQGMAATLEAQSNETNMLIGISKQYFEHEQSCANQLASSIMQLNDAKAEHEMKMAKLPIKIKQQQLEYEEAILKVQQECEASSGEVFQRWKAIASSGVVTADRGGPQALVNRGQTINGYRKLFFDDCLASETAIKRVENMSKQLALNVDMVKVEAENSARKLASLSENLSFKQGITVENCVKGKAQLNYQKTLAENAAAAARTATKRNNFMRILSGVGTCIAGSQGAQSFLPSRATPGASQ